MFFFFKQKTAYEMRISDWSSDVCSSDLFEAIWQQVENDREQGRTDPDDEGKDDEEVKADYRAIAERRVRLGLLLSEVGRLNQIEVTQDAVHKGLFMEAQRHPGQENQVVEFYRSNPQAPAQPRAPLFEDQIGRAWCREHGCQSG